MQTFVSNLRPAEILRFHPPAICEDESLRASVEGRGLDADGTRVSSGAPCPICQGLGDCRTHIAEQFARCVREPSERRLATGGGMQRVERAPADINSGSVHAAGERLGDASPGIVP
jgi:hypothetical protein